MEVQIILELVPDSHAAGCQAAPTPFQLFPVKKESGKTLLTRNKTPRD